MSDVVAIVEGRTEQVFVKDQLAAHLGCRGITIRAILSGRKGKDGGVKPWDSIKGDILRTLRMGCYCTTMFDYYAMPDTWPGRVDARRQPWADRATVVENAVAADIASVLGSSFNPTQFIPYVQLHEFEAIVFSNVMALASVAASIPGQVESQDEFARYFQQVVDSAGDPEAINDGYETCPSRRITNKVRGYQKPLHGPIIAKRIGLDVVRQRCPHFATWLARLESLCRHGR
jgi:hypothetical protein